MFELFVNLASGPQTNLLGEEPVVDQSSRVALASSGRALLIEVGPPVDSLGTVNELIGRETDSDCPVLEVYKTAKLNLFSCVAVKRGKA